jgi:Zn-dependent peptidase ImmA (M78 family)
MKWVKDRSGKFAKRPHYLPDELDAKCEATIDAFLKERYGAATFPISTDDLTILLEQNVDSLDLYAEPTDLGVDVEGVTDFYSSRKPTVKINKRLIEDSRFENRLRTTLTHELGHVLLHGFMFEGAVKPRSLFDVEEKAESNQCKRSAILTTSESDWMEWQAGFACGAYLMPLAALTRAVQQFIQKSGFHGHQISLQTGAGASLIDDVLTEFSVSRDAARVRLLQRGFLTEKPEIKGLF